LTSAYDAAKTAATQTSIDTIDDFLDTEIAAIKAKTDNLPADPADDSDIDAQLAAIAAYIDTEVAAIKAKTDNLPANPAAVGSAMTLADGAITSAKYDESTSFPLKSADSGATQLARAADVTLVKNSIESAIKTDSVWIRPETSSEVYVVDILLYERDGTPVDADSISIAAENHEGAARDLNLDDATPTKIANGHYKSTYTVDNTHASESIKLTVTYTEGALTYTLVGWVPVTDNTETKLDAIHTALFTSYAEVTSKPVAGAGIMPKMGYMYGSGTNKRAFDSSTGIQTTYRSNGTDPLSTRQVSDADNVTTYGAES
jgi:hypothetical protein